MALQRNERYPGRFDNPSAAHPQGAFKNRTSPSSQDGSYLESDWANDWSGFFESLLSKAGVTPNNNVDAVGSSQYFDALTFLSGVSVTGSVRNGTMNVPAASSTATFAADEVVVSESSAGVRYRLSSFSATVNVSSSGAGGMDTGSVPATGFVAVYAIYNPSTGTRALLATNATSAKASEIYSGSSMPSGYTASALVSVWRISSSQFVVGYQSDRKVSTIPSNVLSTSTNSASYTSFSLSGVVPMNAKSAQVTLNASQNTANAGVGALVASTASGINALGVTAVASQGTSTVYNSGEMQIITSQTLYYQTVNTNSGTYVISTRGYSF